MPIPRVVVALIKTVTRRAQRWQLFPSILTLVKRVLANLTGEAGLFLGLFT
jgi:hypothetical protein